MQAHSDIFLGWTRVPNPADGADRDLRPPAAGLEVLGADRADDQNERDYAALKTAVKDGKAQASTEI